MSVHLVPFNYLEEQEQGTRLPVKAWVRNQPRALGQMESLPGERRGRCKDRQPMPLQAGEGVSSMTGG